LKAGIIPLHVWLPEAHPAAPSHVSAVMSGVMIKTGIYGLIRALGFLGPWEPWWGWALIITGLISCLLGAVFALAQHDLKRLLAYSSIENIGIIVLALGLGVLGRALGQHSLAALAFGGALLHVLNHALFKGLLFMGAGAVLHGAGTAEMEALGGLSKRMPRAAALFVLGAAAACALPPLNGFAGEFLIYLGAFSALNGPANIVLAALLVLAVLPAAGALALAVFSKAAGSVFLGEPRTSAAANAHRPGPLMTAGMAALAAACVVSGFAAPFLILPVSTALGAGFGLRTTIDFSAAAAAPLVYVSASFLALAAIAWIIASKRRFVLAGRSCAQGPTWDCGYAAPSARMQYGASSFSQPLTAFFQPLLRKALSFPVIAGYFPGKASFSSEARAVVFDHLYAPVFVRLRGLAFRFSWLQHGRLQFYILYIVAALMALLLWKL
ncbi:MAG TPA: proton-conducting transporter membrane subunit, partial [Elusimicrobiales bacterium]|nr:proton-conducting transporter membrane subunit [Elusimicrobiales bacterium]